MVLARLIYPICIKRYNCYISNTYVYIDIEIFFSDLHLYKIYIFLLKRLGIKLNFKSLFTFLFCPYPIILNEIDV